MGDWAGLDFSPRSGDGGADPKRGNARAQKKEVLALVLFFEPLRGTVENYNPKRDRGGIPGNGICWKWLWLTIRIRVTPGGTQG